MPDTIQIDLEKDVFERLQALAKPFVDTPSSIVRRLLDEAEEQIKQTDSKKSGDQDQPTSRRVYVTSRGVHLPVGRLQATYRRRGSSKAHRFEAAVTPRGIEFDGEVFDDPSPASIRAKELAGAKGSAASTNGWEFWEYFDERKRKWICIDVFRKKIAVPKITPEDLGL